LGTRAPHECQVALPFHIDSLPVSADETVDIYFGDVG
jgi:hypothetical protein